MSPVERRRRRYHTDQAPDAEDRYLRPGWRRRLHQVDGLLAVRDELTVAFREGRVRPEDEDAIAARVEWIDARVGRVSRTRARRHLEAHGRIRGTTYTLIGLVVAAVILAITDAPDGLLRFGAIAIAVTIVVLFALLARAPRKLPGDDDPDLADL